MESKQLPLFEVFNTLRKYGLPLGIDDYVLFFRALQHGIGVENPKALKQLCCTLWAKSSTDVHIFDRIFQDVLRRPAPISVEAVPLSSHESAPIETVPQIEQQAEDDTPLSHIPTQEPLIFPEEHDESIQIVKAVRRPRVMSQETLHPHLIDSKSYFPITRRQMKQSWRHLRRMVRAGPLEDLDIHATIEKVSREGILTEPILVPRRINQATLVLLIDEYGSMTPFHGLTHHLVDTARREGRLSHAGVYYFHDYPGEYLYSDSGQTQAISIQKAIASFSEKTAILIISDAGAARGGYEPERINKTGDLIRKLHQAVAHIAWINPMPRSRWANSTAGKIAEMIPMFELSRQGLDSAINTLQGRYLYSKVQFPVST